MKRTIRKIMKKTVRLVSLCGLIPVFITGCLSNDNTKYISNGNNVDNVLSQQINNAENNVGTKAQETNSIEENEVVQPTEQGSTNLDSEDTGVDYDLTKMGSDMIYATVYQLMVSPEDYIGKTFKMSGLYSATYYEPTKQYYHYCIIEDATACCAQGMEFIWGDGSHIYPEDYPENKSKIIVTGTFETYQDDNDPNLYCRLNNATMTVAE